MAASKIFKSRLAGPRRDAALGLAAALALLLGVASVAEAQQRLYRVVGPNGEVTFTDRPPPVPAAARADPPRLSNAPPTSGLPADLAAVVNRFPITLHTSPTCGAPCDEGRAFLRRRGVPHNERLVITARDGEELQRLSGAATLPMLMVGRQPLVGFRLTEWAGYVDAAGYPATSQLPASYRFAAAAPLTRPVVEAPAVERPAVPPPAAAPPGPGAGGIRF
jgi:hypothetical protein